AVAMLFVGAGLSGLRGYRQLTDPQELSDSWLAIGVLVLAIVTNSYAVSLSVRNLTENGIHGVIDRFREGSQPLVKSALLRDVIGTTTSIIGLVALILYAALDAVEFDAAGAIAAAVMMSFAAVVLMAQARGLITGQSVPERDLERLRIVVSGTPGVEALNSLVAVHSGANHVRVELDLDLEDDLETNDIEVLLDEVEARIREEMPEVSDLRVDLNSSDLLG
ncbi:MAG: hypothetical protein HKN07_03035, partial [Acidimicrobiia bacterium]|nr:hypothetical protein [Acidimicrobiia bacterium]